MSDVAASDRDRGRVFLLDPSLGAEHGHHQTVAANYATLIARRGGQAVFVGNRRASGGAGLPRFAGLFPYRVADAFRLAYYVQPWMAHGALVAAARMLPRPRARFPAPPASDAVAAPVNPHALFRPLGAGRALDALAQRFAPGARDHVVLLNADPALLLALHERAGRWCAPDAARLHIVFVYSEREGVSVRLHDGLTQAYRDLLATPRPPRLYAESPALADWLGQTLAAPVAPILSPVRLHAPPPAPAGAELTVAVLGAARADKGFALLPDIVARASAARSRLAFRIQRPDKSAVGLGPALDALTRQPGVTLLPPHLTPAAYDAEIARARIVLLPYDRHVFALRWSGVLIETLVAGLPFVCTAGSALERAIANENGVAAAPDAQAYAAALIAMAADIEHYAARARALAPRRLDEITDSALLAALD